MQRVRISVRPRFFSGPVCAQWGGKGWGGKKKLRRCGQPLGQSLAQLLLVGFDRQQVVTAGLLHDLPRGVLLRVQGVDADQTTAHVDPRQQLPHGGDFVGLALDQLAAAIILAGRVRQRDHLGAPGVAQGFAIGGQQVLPGARGLCTCVCQSSKAASTRSGSTARNTRPKVALLGEG